MFLKQHKYTATAVLGVQGVQGPGAQVGLRCIVLGAAVARVGAPRAPRAPGETLLPGETFRLEGGVRMVY